MTRSPGEVAAVAGTVVVVACAPGAFMAAACAELTSAAVPFMPGVSTVAAATASPEVLGRRIQ
ncbi:hypothetical protein AOQ71_30325 [Bradyrhizobium manausense]|uniref:Uncharacterized protein n=1 Tax=Bradyrhizobium manausense TaxID=989370 RepID=A0A0R3CZW1_9BRAD|nr:hypothetical protein AOQ71_30325 [Bradyrhizobium manausense]